MATKVHDQDDQDFAEIDDILAQAKLELHRDRCRDRKLRRNMNLSDIPENFALVPASSEPNTRPVSLDTSQPDFASRKRGSSPKLHILGMMAPVKWLRGYMSCLMAVQDVAGREAPDHATTRPASRPQQQPGRRDSHGLISLPVEHHSTLLNPTMATAPGLLSFD